MPSIEKQRRDETWQTKSSERSSKRGGCGTGSLLQRLAFPSRHLCGGCANADDKPAKPEMLTVKECAALVNGLSEHTVRQLVVQDKVAYVRAGSGVRGKILVSKASLLKYLGIAS